MQKCCNYRGMKVMKWERAVKAGLSREVTIGEQQCGFMPRKSTTDVILALRVWMENFEESWRELQCFFVDLEKTCDWVPRQEL